MNAHTARQLNALGILFLALLLANAQYAQFFQHELPCPLCLLQRIGFIGVMFGLMLNVIEGPKPLHYNLSIIAALFGGAVALRQISLHVIPGTPPYGSALLGFHFYTWAFISFAIVLLVLAIVSSFSRQYEEDSDNDRGTGGFAHLAIGLAILMVVINAVTTFVQCGPGVCADNPTHYVLLGNGQDSD